MEYIIRNFDQTNGQITVEYAGKWTYAIDLPVENGALPIGEKLEEIIQGMAPNWLLERQASLETTPQNADVIQALVQPIPEPVIVQITEENKNAAMWADLAFEQKLAKTLVKFGVLESDPTAIPVSEQ
jgi:hypothetical protein